MFGLRDKDVETLAGIFRKHPAVKRVLIYGSRARGTQGRASDIDLAVEAPEISEIEFLDLKEELAEAPIIYGLDVVRLDMLTGTTLKEAILKDGKEVRLI